MTIFTPRACRCQAIRRYPARRTGRVGTAEAYYKRLPARPRAGRGQAAGEGGHAGQDCGCAALTANGDSGVPADDEGEGGTPRVDR